MGSFHWYHPETADPLHDNDLRQARKKGLLPSVTTVQKSWATSTYLEKWISRQKMRKAVLFPYTGLETKHVKLEDCYSTRTKYTNKFDIIAKGNTPEESRKNYFIEAEKYADEIMHLITEWSDEIDDMAYQDLNATAEHGLGVHDQLEQFNLNQDFKFDPKYEDFCNPWKDLFERHIQHVEFAEIRRACSIHKLAGTIDLTCVVKETGLVEVWDYKNRKFKKGKCAFYDKDREQLSFYAWMTKNDMELDYMPRIRSVGINSEIAGEIEIKAWKKDAQERGLNFMFALAAAWRHAKNYYV